MDTLPPELINIILQTLEWRQRYVVKLVSKLWLFLANCIDNKKSWNSNVTKSRYSRCWIDDISGHLPIIFIWGNSISDTLFCSCTTPCSIFHSCNIGCGFSCITYYIIEKHTGASLFIEYDNKRIGGFNCKYKNCKDNLEEESEVPNDFTVCDLEEDDNNDNTYHLGLRIVYSTFGNVIGIFDSKSIKFLTYVHENIKKLEYPQVIL